MRLWGLCRVYGRLRETAGLLLCLLLLPAVFAESASAKKDPGEMAANLLAAAEDGDAQAQYELGQKLLQGDGIPQDKTQGAQWILKAAEQGLARAQTEASQLYREGRGVPPSDAEAVKWMRKAADQGDPVAQYHLGLRHRIGQGVARDFVAASQWARLSADQGYDKAQSFLGTLYANGQGVPQNDREAARWFRYAAEQGEAQAQYNLGIKYGAGKGVHTDYVEAYKWLNLAAAQGNTTAMSARDKIVRKMSREQVAAAQRRSTAFLPRTGVKPAVDNAAEIDPDSPIEANGTGCFITDDGYLLTAYHLVIDARRIAIQRGKELIPAVLVRSDPVNDLALLKVAGQYKSLPLASSREVRIGDAVFTVGYPSLKTPASEPRLAEGNVKALSGDKDDPRCFQVSLPLQMGNTGGPVVDALGNVIAVVQVPPGTLMPVMVETPLFFNAIKSSYVRVFLESIPELIGKLKPAAAVKGRQFAELVKEVQEAVVLVLAF